MQSFIGDDRVTIQFQSSLEHVFIEDEKETQIHTEDMREFLDYLRDAELNHRLNNSGTVRCKFGTIFRFLNHPTKLPQVLIEDAEKRRIMTTCFAGFAALIREQDLEAVLQENALSGVL